MIVLDQRRIMMVRVCCMAAVQRPFSPAATASPWTEDFFFSSFVGQGLTVLTYLSLNISLNMLNKWTLSLYGFKFPLYMSILHMAFSFVALAPIMMMSPYRELHMVTLTKNWTGFLAIGVFFAVNIGFNNISMLSITLSLNQVIRAGIPIVTAVGSIFIENKPPSRKESIALVLLFIGVGIACYEGSDTRGSVIGIILCILGTISNGLMMSSIGKILSEKVDVLRLTFYTAPITCLAILPFYAAMESTLLAEYQRQHPVSEYGLILLLGCANALAYNMVHSFVIKVTSSVTTTVIGEMKIVLILILSAIVLDEGNIWTLKMLIGCTLAILSFVMYSHARLEAGSATQRPVIKGIPDLQYTYGNKASRDGDSSSH